MNRHDRRTALATGSAMVPTMQAPGYTGPTPHIRVLLIDGAARAIKQIIMRMHPDEFRKVLGDRQVKWAKLGEIDERIHIMLAGDPDEQAVAPGHRWFEQEFEVQDTEGRVGPILHGRAVVFGFAPKLKKATSSPVNPIWLEERVRWLEPGALMRLMEKEADATALEDQSGQEGEAEGAEQDGLPALPPAGPLDGETLRD